MFRRLSYVCALWLCWCHPYIESTDSLICNSMYMFVLIGLPQVCHTASTVAVKMSQWAWKNITLSPKEIHTCDKGCYTQGVRTKCIISIGHSTMLGTCHQDPSIMSAIVINDAGSPRFVFCGFCNRLVFRLFHTFVLYL